MKSDAPSFNRGFKNGDNQNLVMTVYKGNDFFIKIFLFNPSLFFFPLQSETWSFWSGKECIFFYFFFPVKKVAFFHSSFPNLLLLQWNKFPSPACTGWDESRGWGTIRFLCISPQCSHAGGSKNNSEVKYCHAENTSMWKSQLQERVNAFLFWRSWCHRVVLAAGEGRVVCELIPEFKWQALMGQECCSCEMGKTKQFCFAEGPHQRWLQRAHDPPIHHLPGSHMRRWDNYCNFNVLHDDLNTLVN